MVRQLTAAENQLLKQSSRLSEFEASLVAEVLRFDNTFVGHALRMARRQEAAIQIAFPSRTLEISYAGIEPNFGLPVRRQRHITAR